MGSLLKSSHIHEKDPMIEDATILDEKFLNLSRRHAETKLIKSRILQRVYEDKPLSKNE